MCSSSFSTSFIMNCGLKLYGYCESGINLIIREPLFSSALGRTTSKPRPPCAVVDGAPWLQEFIDLHRPDAVRILDFPHGAEHLGQAAEATFGAGNPAAATWLTKQCHELKRGDPEQVLVAVANLTPPPMTTAPPDPRETRSTPSGPRLVVNGKPTAQHPWRRFHLPGPHDFSQPAKC